MKGTGSIRTATRCWSCEARRAAAGALLLVAAAACVKPVARQEFEIDPSHARMDAETARSRLSDLLVNECPRLSAEKKSPTGEARVSVDVESASGKVLRARLTQRTEDARVNELFGNIAAQMSFIPPADAAGTTTYVGRMRMGYSCAPGVAVGTIDLF